MFKPVVLEDRLLGHELINEKLHIFFGLKISLQFGQDNDPLSVLQRKYPDYNFLSLKQVHGKTVTRHPSRALEADGHITDQCHSALVIITADCLPILGACEDSVFALHAGWRGVEQNIVGECQKLFKSPLDQAFVGPHIQKNSFEVHEDVFEKLLRCYRSCGGTEIELLATDHASDKTKKYVDLNQIIKVQFSQKTKLWISEVDTVSNTEYCSYRRDGKGAGRNLSFIVKRS